MKSKIRTIIVFGIIGVVVIATSLIILLNGSKNGGFNYARIDYGASIEFVTDTKNTVVSYRPLNEEGRCVLAGIKVEGEKIDNVITHIMEDSFKMGYFDMSKTVIPIHITTVGGITQAFDIKVYEAINDFLVDNQIMGLIIENVNDKNKYMEARELKVSSNELMLIDSVVKNTNIPRETLKNKMPDELIDIIMDIDDEYIKNNPILKSDMAEKEECINNYKEQYVTHKSSVSKENMRAYMEKRSELKRKYQRKLELGTIENI